MSQVASGGYLHQDGHEEREEMDNQRSNKTDKVIPVNNLTEKAFWASVDEEKYASANLISELQSRFGSKPSLSKQESSTSEHGSAKKCKELRFLDSKGRVHSK